ncbi:MAG TPA: cell division protein FtsL [Paenalcaligenes sp.]|nr:cell division protein FtsL [Paenalcaligenes sp.]
MRVLAIFILAVFLMGFHLITTRYHARDLYVQIEQLRGQAEDLDAQWRRLQLERAELTRNARIDELARENFSMAPAGPEHTIYLPAGRGSAKAAEGGAQSAVGASRDTSQEGQP